MGISGFEWVVLGILVALLLFWWTPGIRQAMARSRSAPKDWPAALLPIGVVVAFVLLLILSVRR